MPRRVSLRDGAGLLTPARIPCEAGHAPAGQTTLRSRSFPPVRISACACQHDLAASFSSSSLRLRSLHADLALTETVPEWPLLIHRQYRSPGPRVAAGRCVLRRGVSGCPRLPIKIYRPLPRVLPLGLPSNPINTPTHRRCRRGVDTTHLAH